MNLFPQFVNLSIIQSRSIIYTYFLFQLFFGSSVSYSPLMEHEVNSLIQFFVDKKHPKYVFFFIKNEFSSLNKKHVNKY